MSRNDSYNLKDNDETPDRAAMSGNHPDVDQSEKSKVASSDSETQYHAEKERDILSGEVFQEILQRIDALGLTWTEDIPPLLKPKRPQDRNALAGEEIIEIIENYPRFPHELGAILARVLLGAELPAGLIGTEEALKKKVEAASELLITPEFRHEFFFKNSLKVPCFSDADWDVSIKVLEKGVESVPIMPYVLISIFVQEPFKQGEETEQITFAADEKRIHRLLMILKEAQTNLERARRIKEILEDKHCESGEKEDA